MNRLSFVTFSRLSERAYFTLQTVVDFPATSDGLVCGSVESSDRAFRLHLISRFLMFLANNIATMVLAWDLYSLTRTPLALGVSGAVAAVPTVLLFLPAGRLAEKYALTTLKASYAIGFVVTFTLGVLAYQSVVNVPVIYGSIVVLAAAQTVGIPSASVLVATTVNRPDIPRALAHAQVAIRLGVIVGPLLGGLLYSSSTGGARGYFAASASCTTAFLCTQLIRTAGVSGVANVPSRAPVMAGIRHAWNDSVILHAIALAFSVTAFGGTAALLPVIARDVLSIGADGLGFLRSTFALGALTMAWATSRFPPASKLGRRFVAAMMVFGVSTVALGFSRTLVFSMMALFVMGASDVLILMVRQTLVYQRTDAALQGRVSAFDTLLVSSSAYLGAIVASASAAWMGVGDAAVVAGSIVFALATAAWAWSKPLARLH